MSFSTDKSSGVAIKDEGITILNPANSIDFVGTGVTATAVGSTASVNIPGGGSTTEVRNEVPTDHGDGTFTLAHSPLPGTLIFFKNGIRMLLTGQYSVSGTTITLVDAYEAATYTADYLY